MLNSSGKGSEMKKAGEGGGKLSILSGMKIKSTKEPKYAAQTETNLNFTEKKGDEGKPISRDDSELTKKKSQQEYQPPLEVKEEETSFKKTVVKSPEISAKPQKIKSSEEKAEDNPVEDNKKVEAPPQVPKNLVQTKNQESKSSKSYKNSNEEQPAKSDLVARRYTKNDVKEKKTEVSERKKSEKPISSKKSEQSFSTGRRPSAVQPEKAKKSDREQVIDEINEFTVKLVGVVIYQRQIKVQIVQAKTSMAELREQIARWTSQQALCAEREEYEQADKLQTSILQAQKKVQEMQVQLSYMQEQVIKQEHEEVSLLKSQNSNMKRLSRRLKLVELQLQDDAANLKRDELEKIESLRTRQDNERKKMVRIEKDVGFQGEQIAAFEKQFRKELDSKINPLLEQREDLETNKTSLQSQIRQLQRKLKEKKASLTEVVKELKSVHESILDIENTFRDQSDKLQERKNKLEIIQNEKDQIQHTIDDIEASIDSENKCMEDKYEQKMGEAQELADLAKNIEEKQITFDDQLEARRAALDSFLLNANSVKEFENKHRAEKEKLKEMEYKKGTVTAEISKLQERREELKKMIPGLEAEQKKFAEQKNFKAAGVKKGEVREINEELATIKERLDDCLGEEHSLEVEYQELNAAQKEANEEEAELQKNLAYSQVKYDGQKLKKLEEYLQTIKKASGLQPKNKDKYVKELSQQIARIKEESKYLISHFELVVSPKKEKKKEGEKEEEEPELEDRGEVREETEQLVRDEVSEGSSENKNKKEKDNNEDEEETKYKPLVIQSQEGEELQENQEGGYVPLQLD